MVNPTSLSGKGRREPTACCNHGGIAGRVHSRVLQIGQGCVDPAIALIITVTHQKQVQLPRFIAGNLVRKQIRSALEDNCAIMHGRCPQLPLLARCVLPGICAIGIDRPDIVGAGLVADKIDPLIMIHGVADRCSKLRGQAFGFGLAGQIAAPKLCHSSTSIKNGIIGEHGQAVARKEERRVRLVDCRLIGIVEWQVDRGQGCSIYRSQDAGQSS